MRHIWKYLSIMLAGGFLSVAGASAQEKAPLPAKDQPPPPALVQKGPPPFCGLGIVFVINEVGDNELLSLNMKEVLCTSRAPFAMDVVHWSSFDGRHKDHRDPDRRVQAATCLAGKIVNSRRAQPHARVIVLAHGDGSHIALLAAEMVPPKSVDRIILLAPSVSCLYDLRPALQSTRDGIDNFFCKDDSRLEHLQDKLRTADGKRVVPPAGTVGFCVPAPRFPGIELYQTLLRQHKWSWECENFDHVGWHNSWVHMRFLRPFVLPLLSMTEPVVAPPPNLVAPPKK